MNSIQLNDTSFLILQSAVEVHRILGPGLLESVYRTCMIYELRRRDLKVVAEQLVSICYKEVVFEGGYRLDLQVADEIIVELKAIETLLPVHQGVSGFLCVGPVDDDACGRCGKPRSVRFSKSLWSRSLRPQ